MERRAARAPCAGASGGVGFDLSLPPRHERCVQILNKTSSLLVKRLRRRETWKFVSPLWSRVLLYGAGTVARSPRILASSQTSSEASVSCNTQEADLKGRPPWTAHPITMMPT